MDKLTVAEILADIDAHWPEVDTPAARVVLSLIRLNDLVAERYKAVLAQFALSQAGFEVLVTLRTLPEPRRLTPTELYRSILITSGGMTKVMHGLEAAGLVRREDNAADRRSRYVALTAEGARVAEASMQAVSDAETRLFAEVLSEQQVSQLANVLLRTVGKIEGARPAAD